MRAIGFAVTIAALVALVWASTSDSWPAWISLSVLSVLAMMIDNLFRGK